MLLLKLHVTEGNSCRGQKNENGTLSFSVSSGRECDEYSWKINGSVEAHDQNFTKTLVQESGRSYIILKSCQINVSYFCDKDTTVACAELIHEKNTTDGAGDLPVITVIVTVAGVVITGVIVFIVVRWKLKK
ncbi:hypothetical protein SRHO_G00061260 [Serrasalmus rhombeus]